MIRSDLSEPDLVVASLEAAAEQAGDITAPVYARYYAMNQAAGELMSYVDPYMQGRMLAEVLRLVMVDDIEGEADYLDFEIDNHTRAYQVQPEMYPDLLTAVQDTVREMIGDAWTSSHERAWQTRLAELTRAIGVRAGGSA